MQNNKSQWIIYGGKVITMPPFLVAGIVNVTPDSFSDGGAHFDTASAVKHAINLFTDGAGILDLGGESTRPGSAPIDAAEEQRRVLPVLNELLKWRAQLKAATTSNATGGSTGCATNNSTDMPLLSVDTWRSPTAAKAMETGADIINDVGGMEYDPAILEVLAEFKPGYILGHAPALPATMQKAPSYTNVVEEVYSFFARKLEVLEKAGLPSAHVVLDPGLGFGKTLEHNLSLLQNVERLQELGRPLCIGISRKTFFNDLLKLPKNSAADAATQVVTALSAARGAQIHRVHAVKGAVDALTLALAMNKQ